MRLLKLSLISPLLLLTSCASNHSIDGPPSQPVNIAMIKNAVPHYLPKSRYGNPRSYVIKGKRYYVLNSSKHYNKTGIASWYGSMFHGRLTSTRERYNMLAMTAASPELPLPCFVRVTNLQNNRSVIVKVNDRGPFSRNRLIDLSYAAALKLDYTNTGTALVRVSSLDIKQPTHYAFHKPTLYLQVGAFSQHENAIRTKLRTKQVIDRNVVVISSSEHGRRLYKVQVGPLIGVGQADTLLQELNYKGFNHVFSVVK